MAFLVRLFPALALLGLLAGCRNAPDSYPPPIQREPLPTAEPEPVGAFVNMNDPMAEDYFVKDISKHLEAGSWRWCHRRPELCFHLKGTENLKLVMDFSIADVTFAQTGPFSVSFLVNGRLLDKKTYTHSGDQHFEKVVPASWLRTDGFTTVAAEPDKYFVAPADGVILTFTLTRAGFQER